MHPTGIYMYKLQLHTYMSYIYMYTHVNVQLQVVVGDQMTCKNIRSARALMQPEVDPIKQLNWVHEVPGKQLQSNLQMCGCESCTALSLSTYTCTVNTHS